MQKIKNKQTGETLTGEIITDKPAHGFFFKIQGCNGGNDFRKEEWEILPPPLPTGLGAVVHTHQGKFVRIHRNDEGPWRLADAGTLEYSDKEIQDYGVMSILSQGWNP